MRTAPLDRSVVTLWHLRRLEKDLAAAPVIIYVVREEHALRPMRSAPFQQVDLAIFENDFAFYLFVALRADRECNIVVEIGSNTRCQPGPPLQVCRGHPGRWIVLNFIARQSQKRFGYPSQVGAVNQKDRQASPLDRGYLTESCVFLEKIDDETPAQVRDHESREYLAGCMRGAHHSPKQEGEGKQKDNLVNLRWMPGHSVAEVHSPRQGRRGPICLIGQSGQETADSSDGNANCQGDRKQIARGRIDAQM